MTSAKKRPARPDILPVHLRVTVTCPICRHRVPFETLASGLAAADSFEPELWRLWPRKPDGGRGFHWERLEPAELHALEQRALETGRFEQIWRETLSRMSRRMAAWLERFGIDADGTRLGVHLSRPPGAGP
jgi:hypothetical protein